MSHGVPRPPKPERPLYVVGASRRSEPADERALVIALGRGETHAAVALYERLEPLVRRLLVRVLGPAREVDDLVQEAFLRIFEHAPGLANPQALVAFVITTTTRVAQSELRRLYVRRIVRLSNDGEIPELPTLHPDPAAREAVLRFYRVLDRLSPGDRTAFVLRFMEELELTEVASALGVSLATIKRRLDRIWTRVSDLVRAEPGLEEYVSSLREGTS